MGSLLIVCDAAVARAAVMHVRITVCSGNFYFGSAVVQDTASPSSWAGKGGVQGSGLPCTNERDSSKIVVLHLEKGNFCLFLQLLQTG